MLFRSMKRGLINNAGSKPEPKTQRPDVCPSPMLPSRAALIRDGKLDNEMPCFEELTGWLQRVPMTWLPALLSHTVHQCVLQGVFQDGKLVEHVKAAEKAQRG